MRWRQIVPTAALAAVAGYLTLQRGASLLTTTAAAVGLYIGARWLTAWAFRTRYWYHHEGRNGRTCPSCRRTIYRRPGDWVLRCYGCGWTAGWPGTRLLTRSVPSQQLRRTVAGPGLVVMLVLVAVVGVGVPAGGSGGGASVNGNGTVSPTTAPADAEYERAIHERVNDIRDERGVPQLEYSDDLAAVARGHSEDMAEREYFDHESPDGVGVQERMQEAGVGCRAAENIARYERYDSEPDALAEQIVGIWMDSPPHRENILQETYQIEGIGVYTSGDEIWVTQNFC